jgi:hypothetical protein
MTINPTFRIDPYMLHLIEEARAGRDLNYNVSATILTVPQDGSTALTSGNVHAFGAGLQRPSSKISQSDWAGIVKAMGFGDRAVMEIPFGQPPTSAEVQVAANRLQEAQALFFEGKIDEVVGKCRKALEALNPAVSAKGSGPGPVSWTASGPVGQRIDKGSPGQTGRPSKSQRIEGMTASLWEFLHIGPHENYQVFREDAELALWLTSQIVRYYALALASDMGP